VTVSAPVQPLRVQQTVAVQRVMVPWQQDPRRALQPVPNALAVLA